MTIFRISGFLVAFLLVPFLTDGQQKYWIYLNHKTHLPKNCSPHYCRSLHGEVLASHGIETIVYSEWLLAATAVLESGQPEMLERLSQIDSIRPVNPHLRIAPSGWDVPVLDAALQQTNADVLIREGLSGNGIPIGIIDAGFYKADRIKSLEYVFNNKGFISYRNFVETELNDPFSRLKSNDYHGSRVWQLIAGYDPDNQEYTGLAKNATYYLARTDEDPREYRGEEDFWIAAVEWMHAEGVRIINSSLGYADGHDDPEEDYLPTDADGKSAALTRFANIAVNEKGLLIIMSAGNSGNEQFSVVNIPADAPGVIAVGATHLNHWSRQNYSSIGKYTLPSIKPDVACYSSGGTSFAAPVITGLAACLMEYDSSLTNFEVIGLLKKSSHLRNFPNNYLGYGVPDAKRALMTLKGIPTQEKSKLIKAKTNTVTINIEANRPVLFHKLNAWEVSLQDALEGKGTTWTIERPSEEISHTTFATTSEAVEIIWPD